MNSQFTANIIKRFITGAPIITLLFFIYFYAPFWVLTVSAIALTLWILSVEWPKLVSPKTKFFWIITPFYPAMSLIIMILMLHSAYRPLLAFTILLIFFHDSAAYFIGNLWGKHLLAPKISPKKTWEGAIAGYLAVYLSLLFLNKTNLNLKKALFILIVSFIFSILATTGDLFESWFKRRAHLKDSGSLLPGHGGLLDKFDGLLFVIPALYLLLPWIHTILIF